MCITLENNTVITNFEDVGNDRCFVNTLKIEQVYTINDEKLIQLNESTPIIKSDSIIDQFYYNLFNTISEGVLVQDKESKILEVNESTIKMLGYPREI